MADDPNTDTPPPADDAPDPDEAELVAYLDGELLQIIKRELEHKSGKTPAGLTPSEAAVFALLKARLAAQKKKDRPLPELLKRSLSLISKAAK